MTLTGLLLPLPGALSTDTGSPESGARSLSHLVYEYLGTEDPDRASLLLADILRDPRADLETVGMMIKEGRPYGMEPIGVQPGLPVRVRDHNYRYGLFVPPSYRPTKEYALVVCLHGAGFTGDTYLERWQTRLGGTISWSARPWCRAPGGRVWRKTWSWRPSMRSGPDIEWTRIGFSSPECQTGGSELS